MSDSVRNLEQTLASLPPITATTLRRQTRSALAASTSVPVLVILDDDPTGTQTCHDIIILTAWNVPCLVEELRVTPPGSGFFILTNSRALHPEEARSLIVEICKNLQAASRESGTPFEVVLRSDSTLRGHFPLEAEAAESVVGEADAWILCPFFLQGGRYTIDDVHYVQEGEKLIPAGQTPFAKDATYGYKSSNLRDYVVEKSKGAIAKDQVTSITLETIRSGGMEAVLKQLMGLEKVKRPVVVLNAAADEDVDVVVAALMQASSSGKRFLYRSGAALVSARLAIESIAPISSQKLGLRSDIGGLIIAGSYVPKTTAQLEILRSRSGHRLTTVVLDVRKLLVSGEEADAEVAHAVGVASSEIARGQDVLVMTSREVILGEDEKTSLDIGSAVAKTLVSFLEKLEERPRYVIAKGGITSSDMATKGLKFKRANIVGQAAKGVPLWRCDEDTSKWAGIPYVVFPGNVGTEETLFEVVDGWRG